MVWGCFAWSGVGNLVKINGSILKRNLKESARKIGLGKKFIFQQDNDPKHTAHKITAYFRAAHVKLLEWPPN